MKNEALIEENKKLKQQLKEKEGIINELDNKVRELKDKVTILELLHFGPKSEKWTKEDELQGRLFNEAEDESFKQHDSEQEQAVIETIEIGPQTRRKKRNQGRKPITADLPREEVIYDISEEEKKCACGCKKTYIGSDDTERVKIKPPEVTVIQEKRLKYACKNCEGTEADEPGVTTAEGKKHLISGSIADSSMLAWVIAEKYVFGLPLYRQEKRLYQIGLPISRATLSNLVIRSGEECEVLYELMKNHIRSGPLINADETRVQVLKEPGRSAQALSWMWVFYGGPPGKPGIIFQYDERRSSEVPYDFLNEYEGWLQTDDWGAYQTALKRINALQNKKKIKHILCWAHSRSMFYKSWKVESSPHAQKAMAYIRKLFALEDLRKDYSAKRFNKQRKYQAELIFEEFKPWLEKLYVKTPPGSRLGKALAYTLDNWDLLVLYINHPFLTPSNNIAENAIRPFVIGRKNWLFSCTPRGAKASAIMYSLVESAKLNNLVPYEYLYYIFEKLPYAKSEQDYINLLPFNLTPADISLKV